MAGHNEFEKIRRSTPEQVAEHRRWARYVLDGATLAELRALKGKTQAEVGAALGVTQVQAGRVEKGGEEMQISTLRRYLDALGLELEGVQVRDREHDERVMLVRLSTGGGENRREGNRASPAKRRPEAARVTDRLRRRNQG